MKINSEVRYASHPDDVKHYDTAKLREHYLMEKVFSADEINIVYTMHDRMMAGGAMPVNEVLELKPIDILRSEYFLSRREMGIFNVGGKGFVKAGEETYPMDYKEALYLGRGDRKVTFESLDPANLEFVLNNSGVPDYTGGPVSARKPMRILMTPKRDKDGKYILVRPDKGTDILYDYKELM